MNQLLLSAGWNDNGELGRYIDFEEDENDPAAPVEINSDDIKLISSGACHSIVVLKNGTVLGWGSNHSGQIGLDERMIYPSPTEIPGLKDKNIIGIACCTYGTTFLAENGNVYIARKNVKNPTFVNVGEPCVKCCNGFENPLVIGQSGKLYEICRSNINQHQVESELVEAVGGKSFIVAVAKNGLIYGIGDINEGSKQMKMIGGIKDKKFKRVFGSSRHCFALSNDGIVYAWGSGSCGQLGLGDILSTTEFQPIKSIENITDISTSSLTTCFIKDDRKFYVCGNYGAYLLSESSAKVYTPFDASRYIFGPALAVACGDHHTLVLVEGSLKYQERNIVIDPELVALRKSNEMLVAKLAELIKKAEQEELLKRKAEEEYDAMKAQAHEEAVMRRKAEEEAESLYQKMEEEEKERRRLQKLKDEEERRKREEEEALRRLKELENAEKLKLIQRELEEMRKKAAEEESLRKKGELDNEELKKRYAAANARIDELTKELEDLKNEIASKSKCCNIF